MESISENGKGATRIIMNILRLGAYLHRTGNRIVGEYGLNQQQFIVLNEILLNKAVSPKQLTGDLLYKKSNVSKIVKKLKTIGFIEVLPSPDDGRKTVLNATEKGESVWRQCMKRFDAWNKDWIKLLSPKEVDQAIQIQERLLNISKPS